MVYFVGNGGYAIEWSIMGVLWLNKLMVYLLEISLILWVCPLVDWLFINGAAYLILHLDATLTSSLDKIVWEILNRPSSLDNIMWEILNSVWSTLLLLSKSRNCHMLFLFCAEWYFNYTHYLFYAFHQC
jgi:hypothetical protein